MNTKDKTPKALPTVTLSELETTTELAAAPEELGEPASVAEGAVEYDRD
jgi:hypothetical protein